MCMRFQTWTNNGDKLVRTERNRLERGEKLVDRILVYKGINAAISFSSTAKWLYCLLND
jgi:hypothetical protein